MWNEVCEVYSPDAENDRKLKELDLNTLNKIYNELNTTSDYLKENYPKNKCIVGMELARHIVFDFIIDKEIIEKE